jgi:hypothetical protein
MTKDDSSEDINQEPEKQPPTAWLIVGWLYLVV